MINTRIIILKGSLKSMMICKLVDIKGSKSIKRIRKLQICRNELIPIHSNQMCSSYNTVQMDHRFYRFVVLQLGLYYPHPSLFIWVFVNASKPLHKDTG